MVIHRFERSGWASGPAIIAAVMADRLSVYAPNSAAHNGSGAGGRQDRPRRHVLVAERAQHREARHVLARHRDDVERHAQRDQHDRVDARRHEPDRRGDRLTLERVAAGRDGHHGRRRDHGGRHRPAWREAGEDEPDHDHRQALPPGVSPTDASTGARQIGSRMPASMALAMGVGMRVIARASHGHSPVMSSRIPHSTNAPTAAEKSSVSPLAATHERRTGRRPGDRDRHPVPQAQRDRQQALEARRAPAGPTRPRPESPRPSAVPRSSSANELANPVSEATIPAEIGWAMETGRSDAMGLPA